MDERVWRNLPESLIERILTLLPATSLLRLRSVCKSWNSLILSREFRQLCVHTSSGSPHFILFSKICGIAASSCLAAFNPVASKWHDVCVPIRGHPVSAPSRFLPKAYRDSLTIPDVSLVACAGGLVCVNLNTAHWSGLCVCNPLTKAWKELPSMPREETPPYSTAMVVKSGSSSYKIVVMGYGRQSDQTAVYDSSKDAWKKAENVPRWVGGLETYGVFCGDILYVVACLPYVVLSFDTETRLWDKVDAPMPSGAVCPHLVEWVGRLLMVAGYDEHWEEGQEGKPTSIHVWGLDQAKGQWVAMSSMPEPMCKQFFNRKDALDCFNCVAHGDLIYLSHYDGAFMLVHNLLQSSWLWLPTCPEFTRAPCVQDMFVFQPSLDTPV